MFELDPRLAAGSVAVAELELCQLRLIDDSRFVWLILVPRRAGLRELHHLTEAEQRQLVAESGQVARLLEQLFEPDKLNIGALGNIVPQFHWHLVVRHEGDPCWPGPVWGCGDGIPYSAVEREERITSIAAGLSA